MIKLGAKVKFLNDIGGGVVVRIINKNTVAVENEDGFEIPTLINQLIAVDVVLEDKDDPAEMLREVEPEEKKEHKIYGTETEQPAFYLAFVPQDSRNPVGGEITVHFVNASNFQVMFHYSHLKEEKYHSMEEGNIAPKTTYELERFTNEELSYLPEFCFQLVYYSAESDKLYQPITKCLKVSPVKFYKENSFRESNYFQQKTMQFAISENLMELEMDKLTDDDFKKVIREKEAQSRLPKKQSATSKNANVDLIEIDLHIHELLDDTSGLSNREMLEIQMDKFKSEMDDAIKGKAKKIVFIHGVGNGTLKTELHKVLKSNYKKYYFQDASFKEYGYGATMVMLRK